MFAARDGRRFKTPQQKKSRCAKLAMSGEVVQDPCRGSYSREAYSETDEVENREHS